MRHENRSHEKASPFNQRPFAPLLLLLLASDMLSTVTPGGKKLYLHFNKARKGRQRY